MKLLLLTRKVDSQDERVGFVTDWILEFAKNIEILYIICQESGKISELPENVKIYSLGKEKGYHRFHQLLLFYFYIFKFLFKVDGVFSHMIPHYAVLAGPWCRLFNKKLIQWYTHKSVDFWLKAANFFVDEFVTASKESFRLETKKPVYVFGHGINIKRFAPTINKKQLTIDKKKFVILSVGRISPSKNIDVLIKMAERIKLKYPEFRHKILFKIIGGPGLVSQKSYYLDLINEAREKNLNDIVEFKGPLPWQDIPYYLQNSDLFINLSDTGSLDKAVLEAMASGSLALTSNEAFKDILPEQLFCSVKGVEYLINKIKDIYLMSEEQKNKLRSELRKEIEQNHNLEKLIKKILKLYK